MTIDRMVSRYVDQSAELLILVRYTFIYCLPGLVLLLVGTLSRDVTKKWLEKVVIKLGAGLLQCSLSRLTPHSTIAEELAYWG